MVILPLLAALALAISSGADRPDGYNVVFWNLENFFDYIDRDTCPADREFSARGTRRWTRKRFLSKCLSISKGICHIADRCGGFPDLIGVAEVENRFVLKRLLDKTVLDKAGYGIVHFDSPDRRGIDVALLYRKRDVKLLRTMPLRIDSLQTRDILLAKCSIGSDTLDVAVCHLPSKFGGGKASARQTALRRMRRLRDSLCRSGAKTIIMGDFNEEALHSSISPLTSGDSLVNLAAPLAEAGAGSIRYRGRWEMIDMFLASPEIADRCSMQTVKVPFLMERDNTHAGMKPKRTYVGPRYNGGVSDHLPILLHISAQRQL